MLIFKGGSIMRPVILGILFTVFLMSAGVVQATNDLDGKAVLCVEHDKTVYGLVFDSGMVTKWIVSGYSKIMSYTDRKYHLDGTNLVKWRDFGFTAKLNRETLKIWHIQCAISSKVGIFQKLDEIIATAKKKNKL